VLPNKANPSNSNSSKIRVLREPREVLTRTRRIKRGSTRRTRTREESETEDRKELIKNN